MNLNQKCPLSYIFLILKDSLIYKLFANENPISTFPVFQTFDLVVPLLFFLCPIRIWPFKCFMSNSVDMCFQFNHRKYFTFVLHVIWSLHSLLRRKYNYFHMLCLMKESPRSLSNFYSHDKLSFNQSKSAFIIASLILNIRAVYLR